MIRLRTLSGCSIKKTIDIIADAFRQCNKSYRLEPPWKLHRISAYGPDSARAIKTKRRSGKKMTHSGKSQWKRHESLATVSFVKRYLKHGYASPCLASAKIYFQGNRRTKINKIKITRFSKCNVIKKPRHFMLGSAKSKTKRTKYVSSDPY